MRPPTKSPNRPAPPNPRRTANTIQNRSAGARYAVQPPVPLGGQGHQIRATLQGTRQVAGSVDMSKTGAGKVFISNLRVDNEHRRRGIASQLIDAAVNTARRQGFQSVSLEARPSDSGISAQALVAMYRRQGFKNVGKSQRGSPMMERKLR